MVGVREILDPRDHLGSRQAIALGTVRVIYSGISSRHQYGQELQTLYV